MQQVMDSSPSSSPSSDKYSPDIDDQFNNDFRFKLLLEEDKPSNQSEMDEEGEDDDEEFSFVYSNGDGSSVSADDIFQNGQIRPVFPLFNQDLIFVDEDSSSLNSEDSDLSLQSPLMKVFVEDSLTTSEPVGPYCEWRRDRITVEETSSDTCKKSNSTGFSKLRRVRNLIHRSNSDGKDAFVLLNHPFPFTSFAAKIEKKNEKEGHKEKLKGNGEKQNVKKDKSGKTTSVSAHEKLYVKNRAMREGDKRRSYLPYRQVGFFTNVNGLSRNVHPF